MLERRVRQQSAVPIVIDAGLIGPERAAALQHQRDAAAASGRRPWHKRSICTTGGSRRGADVSFMF